MNNPSRRGSEIVRSCPKTVDAGLGCSEITVRPDIPSPIARVAPSRILDDRALPGEGGGMDFGVAPTGEPCERFSSLLPPSMEEMDMLPVDLLEG